MPVKSPDLQIGMEIETLRGGGGGGGGGVQMEDIWATLNPKPYCLGSSLRV